MLVSCRLRQLLDHGCSLQAPTGLAMLSNANGDILSISSSVLHTGQCFGCTALPAQLCSFQGLSLA